MDITEYAVQAVSRSTGSSGRWVNCSPPIRSRHEANRIMEERRLRNGQRAVYRIVTRTVTPWTPDNT